jgi:hypothetical protein
MVVVEHIGAGVIDVGAIINVWRQGTILLSQESQLLNINHDKIPRS